MINIISASLVRRLSEVWFVSRTGTIRSANAINDPNTGSTTAMHDPTYALSITVIGKNLRRSLLCVYAHMPNF